MVRDQHGRVEQRVPGLLDGAARTLLSGDLHGDSSVSAGSTDEGLGSADARVSRSANSSDGEIGIAVIANALGVLDRRGEHRGRRDHARLAGALDAERVERRGRLEVVDVDRGGHLGDVGHEEVHERGVEQLARLVVDHPLVERPAHALGDAAVDLALDDHRVDQVAAVVDDGVLEDRDLGGVGVGLDDHRVHAVGEGRALGRVEVLALQPRLVVLGHRRLAGVADGELGGRLGRLVEGVAQRVGEHRDRAEVDRRVRSAPFTDTTPSTISRSSRRRLQRLGRDPQRLLRARAARRGGSPTRSSPRRARRTCRRRRASGGCRRW